LESIQNLDSPLPLWEKDITSKSGNLRTTQQRVTFLFEFANFSANCLQISTFFPNFATKVIHKEGNSTFDVCTTKPLNNQQYVHFHSYILIPKGKTITNNKTRQTL